MISKKTPEEIAVLKEAGAILAKILKELTKVAVVGNTTLDIDDRAMELVEEYDVEPVLLGYHPDFAPRPYPSAVCVSTNHCVQHGIPSEEVVFKEGDVVNIDMSIAHKGMVVDSGLTVGVGEISDTSRKLLTATQEALAVGIKAAKPGNHIGDISHAIQTFVEARGFSLVEVLCGHGVGYSIHEEPLIPNIGKPGTGPLIEVGHVYAIEPIVNVGDPDVYFDDAGDGYSVYTKDGSYSAHFEHTVAITEKGAEILTKS
ncbi:type I methionyl aminopeptidase [Candidatus Collierbacteria bacterium CG10_big_fil_rev_8_21_14_0_10_44_9]|uniref:Methionine aminopeptidase n=1 Tax=Candidatus Collierbacteria bacterium CG10_big_fil_rev_8_21_14_0_10_44_9 TaxID=1974535 RepID=A0A2H0VKY4_9BACT|nr:MAG: type I methionyl aminopeptidase [Candidatus Collierbacteria bacterium CG10_big_fil_rev_8_21_14_0_10_44_9]